MLAKKRQDLKYFTTKFKKNLTDTYKVYLYVDRCVEMRASKTRAHHCTAEVTKTKKPRSGSMRQKTAVPKPPSKVLYILPLWKKPYDMKLVAGDSPIKANSVCKGATDL